MCINTYLCMKHTSVYKHMYYSPNYWLENNNKGYMTFVYDITCVSTSIFKASSFVSVRTVQKNKQINMLSLLLY